MNKIKLFHGRKESINSLQYIKEDIEMKKYISLVGIRTRDLSIAGRVFYQDISLLLFK